MTKHLRLPPTLAPDGTFRTVEEDSAEEILQNVTVILRTRIDAEGVGERLATPEFGTADPTFAGFDADTALDVVRTYEPRADVQVIRQVLDRFGREQTDLSVRRRET